MEDTGLMCKLLGQGVSIIGSVMGSKLVIWKEDKVCRKIFLDFWPRLQVLWQACFLAFFREASSIEDTIGGLKA